MSHAERAVHGRLRLRGRRPRRRGQRAGVGRRRRLGADPLFRVRCHHLLQVRSGLLQEAERPRRVVRRGDTLRRALLHLGPSGRTEVTPHGLRCRTLASSHTQRLRRLFPQLLESSISGRPSIDFAARPFAHTSESAHSSTRTHPSGGVLFISR